MFGPGGSFFVGWGCFFCRVFVKVLNLFFGGSWTIMVTKQMMEIWGPFGFVGGLFPDR